MYDVGKLKEKEVQSRFYLELRNTLSVLEDTVEHGIDKVLDNFKSSVQGATQKNGGGKKRRSKRAVDIG